MNPVYITGSIDKSDFGIYDIYPLVKIMSVSFPVEKSGEALNYRPSASPS
jgi:hypothetical protein